ncbi:MAG TPA: hypothetical protein VG456_02800 [Candidatus Sulfopaludibacter sp.]|jgi:hypothetical protein|nr:hypothetical protein [Candidatus Sulfopaludibacter sp.]
MRYRVSALLLAICMTAAAQTMSVEKLSSFLKNATADSQHKSSDTELAAFLSKVKLTDRLDDRAIESLQSDLRLGAKTTAALRKLRDLSQGLAAPAPTSPVEALRPIPVPSAEEQGKVLQDVRAYALSYSQNLPDFICTEREKRFGAPPVHAGSPDWRQLDELTKRLSYFEQKEDYKLIMRNNALVSNQDVKSAGGSQSFGDFGSMMRQVFDPASEAKFEWKAWQTLRGQRVMAFDYHISLDRSRYHITFDRDRDIVTAYHGWIDVDPATHAVMRIAVVAENIPADFPVKSASDILDYDYQDLSGQNYLLPSHAEIDMSTGDYLTRNRKDFDIYRKYSADALIKYDGDLGGATTSPAPIKH